MNFELWLWEQSQKFSDDITVKFAKVCMTGDLAFDWPDPVLDLDTLLKHIDFCYLTDEQKGSYRFAARTAWNDYLNAVK